MNIQLVTQPKNESCCGQACCAMLAHMKLDDVCREFGHRHSSYTREVIRFLRSHGYTCPDRLQRLKRGYVPATLCIVKLRFGNTPMGHFAVYYNGTVYDPALGETPWNSYIRRIKEAGEARVTSYLPLRRTR